MKRIYFFVALALLSTSFFSCKKGDGKPYIPVSSENLIVGKWVLQSEHSVEYINGVKQVDTVYNASQNSYSFAQFNSDGTFTTSGMYFTTSQNNISSGGSNVSFSTAGTYSFAGSAFDITGPLSGFGNGASFTAISSTSVPVITPISNSVQINELTTTNLALHTENIYTYTVNNVSQTYKLENDLSYTR